MNQSDCLLYLVTNSDHLAREPFLRVIEEALQNGVTLLQLREKDKDGREFYEEALAVKELSKRYHVPLLIDDRIDVALAVDADGVHVGQSDLPVSVARKLLGPGKIVGATAKTVAQALEAQSQGAELPGDRGYFPNADKGRRNPHQCGDPLRGLPGSEHPGCGHWRAQTGQLVCAGGMPDQRDCRGVRHYVERNPGHSRAGIGGYGKEACRTWTRQKRLMRRKGLQIRIYKIGSSRPGTSRTGASLFYEDFSIMIQRITIGGLPRF